MKIKWWIISFVFVTVLFSETLSFSDTASKPPEALKQYRRREFHPLETPKDAGKKRVLVVEENRKLESEGNLVRVEGTDDYLGKGIESLRTDVRALHERFDKLEERFNNLELKIKRVKSPEETPDETVQ